MVKTVGTKYPLSAPPDTGSDSLRRLGLHTELGVDVTDDEIISLGDIAVSGHTPLYDGEIRLNIGAIDADFRRMSIDKMLAYTDKVKKLPIFKQLNMHPAPKQWVDENQIKGCEGDYGLMMDGIREIADYASRWGLDLVLENNTNRWSGISDDLHENKVDWSNRTVMFGSSPEEWIQICEDVERSNVALCLDSSHACTYAHKFPDHKQREAVVMAYLSRPDLLKHVHWNDNYLYDVRGREDSHAVLGKGTLPVELHRTIKGLDATLMIEHFYTIKDLEEEIEYISRL